MEIRWDFVPEPITKDSISEMFIDVRKVLIDDYKHPGPDRKPVLGIEEQKVFEKCLAIAKKHLFKIVANGKILDFSEKTA